jgi:hypothetical protein
MIIFENEGAFEVFKDMIKEILREERRAQKLIKEDRLYKEWYTLTECSRLKYGSRGSLDKNKVLRPNEKYAKIIAGRLRYPRAEVARWLMMSDEELKQARNLRVVI